MGLSTGMTGVNPSRTLLREFRDNVAHNNGGKGVWVTQYFPGKTATWLRTKTSAGRSQYLFSK